MTLEFRPELMWQDGQWHEGMQIEVESGAIVSIEPTEQSPTHPREAWLPGFVNAHSHAFQRGLRGRGEVFTNQRDDFWSWREAMYELVNTLTPESAHLHSLRAFREMRAAGITTVGEFHYIHHSDQGRDDALDAAVLAAADEAGVRIVLLHACYLTGGFGVPLSGAQKRFDAGDLRTWWDAVDRAMSLCVSPLQTMGVVIHSLRAVPIDVAAAIRAEASARGMVVHLHLEEQPAEIQAAQEAHGCTPMRLVLDHLDPGPDMTAVHCTHTDPKEMAAYASCGGQVCLCPLTEANLGDGLSDLMGMRAHQTSICLGTDSNARISMFEEMRLCEYGQRLKSGARGVCTDEDGRMDRALLEMGTLAGARSLGVDVGALSVGSCADWVRINLDVAQLQGVARDDLLAAMITGGDARMVQGSVVGGAES